MIDSSNNNFIFLRRLFIQKFIFFRVYKPINRDEEILLSLNLSQYLASTEVMIFRHPQFKTIRELTFKNAISSLDLLLFYLSYYRSFNIISEVIQCIKYN